jgi:hypothetical protein
VEYIVDDKVKWEGVRGMCYRGEGGEYLKCRIYYNDKEWLKKTPSDILVPRRLFLLQPHIIFTMIPTEAHQN